MLVRKLSYLMGAFRHFFAALERLRKAQKVLSIVLRMNEEADLLDEEYSSPRPPPSSAPDLFVPPGEGNFLLMRGLPPPPPPPPSDPLRSRTEMNVCLNTVNSVHKVIPIVV